MSCPKLIDYEDWQGNPNTRDPNDFAVTGYIEETGDKLIIEFSRSETTCKMTMKVELNGRRMHPFCRYELQDTVHPNPAWYPTKLIEPGQPHRHVYNIRAVQENLRWDKCAEPLDDQADTCVRLREAFFTDLNLHTCDRQTWQNLLEFMK